MRFNNRFCALMDIPDLPHGAFEHIGDKKIKPQGGGNPISAVTDPISKAIGTDGSGGGVLGAAAKIDPGKAIGKGLSEVDKFVGREIPGGWKTVGLVAASVAAPYALSAMSTAGAGAAGSAAALAASGLSEAAIAQNLAYAYNSVELLPTAAAAPVTTTSSGGSVIDKSSPIDYNKAGNVIEPGSTMTPEQMQIYDLQQKVAGQEALAKYGTGAGMTTAQKAMMGMQLGQGLLGRQAQPQQNAYQQQVARQQMPNGQVDYSGLLALLQPKSAKRQTSLLG